MNLNKFFFQASAVLLVILLLSSCKKTKVIDLGNGITMKMVYIQAGSFIMGSEYDQGYEDESPQRQVTITKPFYMGQYEVTQEQWQQIMGYNPSRFKGAKNPVDNISWNDCQIFLKKLGDKTGYRFSLPTEAQWEYACRAGTTTKWSSGSQEAAINDYAWFSDNSHQRTQPVGTKKPNRWRLYDMHGNLGEWCHDFYANPYPAGSQADPAGPSTGDARIIRGGAWGDSPDTLRSAYRNCNGADGYHDGIGFRCVLF